MKTDLFTVTKIPDGGTPVVHSIKSVKGEGNEITIVLDDSPTFVDGKDKLQVEIANGKDVDGVTYYVTSTTGKHLEGDLTVWVDGAKGKYVATRDLEEATNVANAITNADTVEKVRNARKAYNDLSAGAKAQNTVLTSTVMNSLTGKEKDVIYLAEAKTTIDLYPEANRKQADYDTYAKVIGLINNTILEANSTETPASKLNTLVTASLKEGVQGTDNTEAKLVEYKLTSNNGVGLTYHIILTE